MEVGDVLLVLRVGDAVQITRSEQRPARRERVDRIEETFTDSICAVAAVDVAIRLPDDRAAYVIREALVLGRAAGLEAALVVQHRRSDAQVDHSESRVGAALDHLVDVARDTRGVSIGRGTAGVDLQFLLTQIRQKRLRRVVVGAVDGNAVELPTDLVEVTAADVDGLIPSLLALN